MATPMQLGLSCNSETGHAVCRGVRASGSRNYTDLIHLIFRRAGVSHITGQWQDESFHIWAGERKDGQRKPIGFPQTGHLSLLPAHRLGACQAPICADPDIACTQQGAVRGVVEGDMLAF